MDKEFTVADIQKAIDKIQTAYQKAEMIYLFSEDLVNNNRSCFYEKDGELYAVWDDTPVKKYPNRFNPFRNNNIECCYVVPAEQFKPIKLAYIPYKINCRVFTYNQ